MKHVQTVVYKTYYRNVSIPSFGRHPRVATWMPRVIINVLTMKGRSETRFRGSIMKVFEFQAQVPPDGTLKLPPDIAAQIPGDDSVHVLLVLGDSSEEADWKRLTADRFLAGYAPSDDIYDAL